MKLQAQFSCRQLLLSEFKISTPQDSVHPQFQNAIAIDARVMPYALKFYAYLFVANVLAVVIVVRWVKPFGLVASLAFGLVFAYLMIAFGPVVVRAKKSVIFNFCVTLS